MEGPSKKIPFIPVFASPLQRVHQTSKLAGFQAEIDPVARQVEKALIKS